MRDFDGLIRSLADEDRNTMIRNLCADADVADRVARSSNKEKRYEARGRAERCGRILYFLRHQSHSDRATDEDIKLCKILETKLRSKGQWV